MAFADIFHLAVSMILGLDPGLLRIVGLSLTVSTRTRSSCLRAMRAS